MANTALTEYLQFHGQQGATGCIQAGCDLGQGVIYLHHGHVVHAETPTSGGLCALFTILGWPAEMSIDWKPDIATPKISFDEGVDTLLFQYAQLEDSGQADEASLKSLFGGAETAANTIRLTELSSYRITFEVTNAELAGVVFHLEREVTLVGRKPDCHVVIPDPTVSSYHCNIILESNCVRVIDLGSTNGTRINGQIITDGIIQVNDDLWVGSVCMRMSMQMQRRLALRTDQAPATPKDVKDASRKSTTVKIDTSTLKVGNRKQPIRWDNVESGPENTKKITGSLLGKFFRK